MKNPSLNRRTSWRFAATALGVALSSSLIHGQATTVSEVDSEDVVELSPFVVSEDENVGYLATTTLAGTRIKTDLRDVGSAISVITPEFMQDTGTTNAEDLLVYTVGTEVGGAVGNFAGSAVANGDEGANRGARANPHNNNRVRGLSNAQTTRDYFLTAFGFDNYNSTGVTISRGPNSILFGIGEPGGIIENSLRTAKINDDSMQVSFRFGSRGSHRQTMDINKVLIKDRLAIRLMGMNERINFKQQPTYEDDQRFTIAATWEVLKNENISWMGPTTIRGNYEDARIRTTPPNTMPPADTYSTWWQPPGNPTADAMVGLDRTDYNANYSPKFVFDDFYRVDTTPGNKSATQPGIWNSYAVVFADVSTGAPGVGFASNDVQVIDGNVRQYEHVWNGTTRNTPTVPLRSTNINPWRDYAGFKRLTIQNRDVFDYHNYFLPGRSQFVNHDFEAYNVSLEQNFFNNKLGFQAVFDHQEKDELNHFPLGRAIYHSVNIDTALYLTNGESNPNVGRPRISGMWDPEDFRHDTRESVRLTGYYNLDFTENEGISKWLGDHTVTGLINSYENDRSGGSYRLSWDDSHDPDQRFRQNQNRVGSWGGSMFFMAYVGDPQFNAATPDDLRLYQGYLNLTKPKVGDEYQNYYYDAQTKSLNYSTIRVQEFLQWPSASRQEIDSEAFTIQSKFFDDNIVLTYGTRTDETKTWQTRNNSFRDNETWAYSADTYTQGWLQSDGSVGTFANADPVLAQKGDTSTKQVVAHVPDRWMDWGGNVVSSLSFHYSESDNFNPASVRRDVYDQVIGNPSGATEDYGLTIGMFDDRAVARVTWYETSSQNITNPNMQSNLWMVRWPLSLAQRWTAAKNGSFDPGGLQFEDYAWHGPNGPGPDSPDATYQPERLGNFQSFDEVINAFKAAWPADAAAGWNPRLEGTPGDQDFLWDTPSSMSTVSDAVSEGMEVELAFNPTRNWRIAFNVAKAESVFSNGLQAVTPFIDQVTANLQSLGLWTINDSPLEGGTVQGRWSNNTLAAYYSALSKENTVATELRKWRWNAVTNYSFSDGPFKGLGVGGAVRWQDEVSTGYPLIRDANNILVPDLQNPYTGGEQLNGDIWFSYRTKIFDRNVRFQLNLQNAFGDDTDIPVTHNPDGTLAIVRIPVEKRFFFTTTIDF